MTKARVRDRLDWNLMDSPVTAGAVLVLLMIILIFPVRYSTPASVIEKARISIDQENLRPNEGPMR